MFKRNKSLVDYNYLVALHNHLQKLYKSKNNKNWAFKIPFANTTISLDALTTVDKVPAHYLSIILAHLDKLLYANRYAEIQRVIIAIFILPLTSTCDLPDKLGQHKDFLNFLNKTHPYKANNLIQSLGFERVGALEYFAIKIAAFFSHVVSLFKFKPARRADNDNIFANVNVDAMAKANHKLDPQPINLTKEHAANEQVSENAANDLIKILHSHGLA